MADEEFSTNDVVLELQQARRSFQVFEHAEQVVKYMLTLEQRVKDAEAFLATVQGQVDAAKEALDERIRTGELRAEAAEQRAANVNKQIAEAQAKSDATAADIRAKLSTEADAMQKKLAVSREELASLKKQIDEAKKVLNLDTEKVKA